MKAKLFPVLAVCLVCFFSAAAQTVIETETGITLNEKDAEIFLAVENSQAAFESRVELKLLDAKSAVRASAAQNTRIENGKKTYQVTMPLGDLMKTEADNIAWFRLQYRVGSVQGIVSLSEILRDAFELRVIATDQMLSGMNYRSRIRAVNPFTQSAVAGVKVSAELILELKSDDDQKLKFNAGGETDREGFAILDFQIPVDAALSDGEIKVTGRKKGVVREAVEDLQTIGYDFQFLMLTDKPIYQPEQALNVRGILLKGMEARTVVTGSEIEFRIEDEDNTVLYREKVKTSSFGIAAVSWKIPANARLGNYSIEVRNADDDQIGYARVKVSRYDLPNFAVNAKALKTFYLPAEKQAEVEVSADYLFGKPVTKGKVRVVQEKERAWNWKEQKYDIDEGESHEGKTDETGKFTAKFDLGKTHDDLKDDRWRKFRDLSFTAYFTDLTTNRTEQRRFDVRVTREPIHVYYIGDRYDQNASLPVAAYVSTFYADGSPAVCSVELKGREEDGDDEKFRLLQKLKTNSFGAGKLQFMRPKFEDAGADLEIEIIARDDKGNRGTFGGESEDYYNEINFGKENGLKIETEKTIFKPGESVKLRVSSTKQTGLVYIDVVKGWSVIDSYFVNLIKGKGEVKIPYQAAFQGHLKVAAFFEEAKMRKAYDYQLRQYYDDQYFDLVKASRGIIFPTEANLKLDARFDKEAYKPGEEAKVSFSVLDTVGSAVESALGVVVFDKAIEERARTESDFNGMFGNFRGWLGYGESFGGVNVKDLNALDLSKPIPDELQLVAEVMFYNSYYHPNIFRSRSYYSNAKSVYAEYFAKHFEPFEKTLNHHYGYKNYEHPTDDESLRKILRDGGMNFEELRDPWGENYRALFDVNKTQNIVQIVSAGADKKQNTADDFAVSSLSFTYFTPIGRAIDKVINDYHRRTGGFIRDEKTLFRELGISELKDRFGRPYRIAFEVAGKFYLTRVHSLGKDGVYSEYAWQDDFDVWTNRSDYFAETEVKILRALESAKPFPADETAFRSVLAANDLDFEKMRDGYGEKLYLLKRQFSRYADKVVSENVQNFGEEKKTERTTVTPVTQEVITFEIRGKGADKKENTSDDATFSQFLRVVSEQTKTDEKPKPPTEKIIYANGTGSISGKITDANDAAVANATMTATSETSNLVRSVTSDAEGKYSIANLAVGNYSVRAEGAGFKISVRSGVPVTPSNTTKVDFTLEAGAVSEVVTVSADSVASTTDATVSARQIENLPINGSRAQNLAALAPGFQIDGASGTENVFVIDGQEYVKTPDGKLVPLSEKATPKLREYFPETLLWSPEIITDRAGRAELKFKMADNITTWKLYTIASTRNGKIGVAEKEVAAFQPFFVDLDPPRFLTDGDEIFLPTQVRNYTPAKQKVDVTMTKADWFTMLSPEKQNIEVEKNSAGNAVFGFKTINSIKDGKQRVTAIAATDSDAIEKAVTVRPNGQEIVRTESKLFSNSASFEINFPANALAKTPRSELKIYPNLMAHVAESVEGLLQRPTGCGEQTISSTYPNLMILKFAKTENFLTKKAAKYLQKGYERLLGYQVADGGFSYWGGKSESDIALTAYALRFLSDAKTFIAVDEKVFENAKNYLANQQRADGSFTKKYYYETAEDARRTKLFTAYVARALAMSKADKNILNKALSYLKTRAAEIDEPYALALFGLAALEAENIETAQGVAQKLETLALTEGDKVYWNLETNTPFYGWGAAGRIETTALVIQLLIKIRESEPKTENQKPKTQDLISRGTMFLLKNKDRYGVWYSTQTTINVLDAFLASLQTSKNQTLQVSLNGEKLKDFAVTAEQIEPLVLDLTDKLGAGANRLEIKGSDTAQIMAQIVSAHYVDWRDAEISSRSVNDSRAIRLDYKCDKQTAKIMETVTCAVEAERVGFKGYGMLLAEIGLPPGADVSRESLEKAFEADWSLSRYDVLPDRIVVYMWAKGGGTKFNFSFKPRYGINAQTPSSIIYDYYNEEAKATAAPLKFSVK